MPRLTKIYTRTGDDGSTMLGSGKRVSKDHARIEVYGTVDELNSQIGVAIASQLTTELADLLRPIQNELFHLGSELCFPMEALEKIEIPRIEEKHVTALERHMDRLSADLPSLENFILPGGTPAASHLHVARTVCRRAERRAVQLAAEEAVGEWVIQYLNRLSDLLFVLARAENQSKGVADTCWDSHA